MNEPRDLVQRLEEKPPLPKGDGELLAGYGVMSWPIASGDILGSRALPSFFVRSGLHRRPFLRNSYDVTKDRSHASRQIAPDAGISETHTTVLRARKPDVQISIESHYVAQ
jgi:hypothetical protein